MPPPPTSLHAALRESALSAGIDCAAHLHSSLIELTVTMCVVNPSTLHLPCDARASELYSYTALYYSIQLSALYSIQPLHHPSAACLLPRAPPAPRLIPTRTARPHTGLTVTLPETQPHRTKNAIARSRPLHTSTKGGATSDACDACVPFALAVPLFCVCASLPPERVSAATGRSDRYHISPMSQWRRAEGGYSPKSWQT
jgi:hypothetical protein